MPNQSTGKSQFEIVCIQSSMYVLDMFLLPKLPETSIVADHMIDNVINIYNEIKR